MSDELKTVIEPVVEPKPGVPKPGVQPGPVVGPTAHGEHAQRFVHKTSRHSERYENHP